MFDKIKFLKKWTAIALSGILLSISLWIPPARADETPQRKALFGDLHVHTKYSIDSYLGWNPNGPEESYRFALGEEAMTALGEPHSLKTELDFTAITDHAEDFGAISICSNPNARGYNSDDCKDLRDAVENRDLEEGAKAYEKFVIFANPVGICGKSGEICKLYAPQIWKKIRDAATAFNNLDNFTTFNAYEWTSLGNIPPGETGGTGIHRNIIFRNENVPKMLFTATDSADPEDLWDWLNKKCKKEEGCEAIVIPHNTNLSKGRAFAPYKFDGETSIDENYARKQQDLERLVEVIQTKGESECRPYLGNTDELCGFEKLDRDRIRRGKTPLVMEGGIIEEIIGDTPCTGLDEPEGCVNKYSYIREGLKEGIKQEAKLGVNPFKYGFVGATDSHSGFPASGEEYNFKGSHAITDATPKSRLGVSDIDNPIGAYADNLLNNPGGVTGVWAEENSRDSIFDALKRRETFATSGPRIEVRLFGGYEFPDNLNELPDAIAIAYSKGVPMGGDLPAPPADTAPKMFVWAMQDTKSAKLHGIQIIKGWLDNNGEPQEKVYAVACSDALEPMDNGLCPPNNAAIDINTCAIPQGPFVPGDAELSTVWQDPDFDPNQQAFYYARVIENPTCRWSTYDAISIPTEIPDDVPPFIRERAWSSPIWYNPELVKIEPLPEENVDQEDFWDAIIQQVEKHYSTELTK